MFQFRLATYNVLSSSLCSASYYTVSPEKFCSSKYRFEGLLGKLRAEVQLGAIICLQEVSLSWAGQLHTFFDQLDYTLVVSNYGSRFNGYMGVGIAFPRLAYKLQACDISCVSDTKSGGWQLPKPKPDPNAVVAAVAVAAVPPKPRWWQELFARVSFASQVLLFGQPASTFPPRERALWDGCKQRNNTLVTLRLAPVAAEPSSEFLVSTYHMPCQFRDVQAMEIYALLCFQRVQALSEGGKYLYVLGGDFNFKPESSQYALAVSGVLPEPHPPKLYDADPFEFRLKLGGMKSAYKEVWGREPDFTNYAATEGKEVFVGVLDYIFYSPQANKHKGKRPTLTCTAVGDLPCDLVRTLPSLPHQTEYSDHLLLAAEFSLAHE